VPSDVTALGSQGSDESTVDDEVSTGDVAGAVAGQQHNEVGHLFGAGESSCRRFAGCLFRDISGFAATGEALTVCQSTVIIDR
jgi:hypothetical protein